MKRIDLKTQKEIEDKIYWYPLIIVAILSILFLSISCKYINIFKDKELKAIETQLLLKEKSTVKYQIDNITNMITFVSKNVDKTVKINIKKRVDEANTIIQTIIANNKGKSKDIIKKKIISILAPLRFFENRGYYFIYDKASGKVVLHPIKRFINKDMCNFTDKKGRNILKLYNNIVNNKGEGYIDNIYFIKPFSKSKKQYRKIIYIKYIKELNWVIGTGEYYDEVERNTQKKIAKQIEHIRYSKYGYFWVHNTNYKLISHPFRQKDIGKNDKELTDSKGTKIIQMFVNSAIKSKNGAFVEYYWQKPNEKNMKKKISYVEYLPSWHWVIGTGLYIEDINKVVNKQKKKFEDDIYALYIKLFLVVIIIFLITFFISRKLSLTIQYNFNRYLQRYEEYADEVDKLNKSLELKVQERTKELNELNENLEKRILVAVEENKAQQEQIFEQLKFVQMGEMIGNIAHQWRQPLSFISTVASGIMMTKEFGELPLKDENKMLQDIIDNTNYLSDTIDIFRNYILENKEKKEVILQDRIHSALQIVEGALKNSNVEVINKIDNIDKVSLNIVVGELSQVIINILNNAKDAICEKNINNGKVIIMLEQLIDEVDIIIEDNAGGIDKDIISKVFDPYFTTKHKSQGTGLGLYMSKEIIEKHLCGKLSVVNIENGVRFKITLPLK